MAEYLVTNIYHDDGVETIKTIDKFEAKDDKSALKTFGSSIFEVAGNCLICGQIKRLKPELEIEPGLLSLSRGDFSVGLWGV
jgi:hypothetical protein